MKSLVFSLLAATSALLVSTLTINYLDFNLKREVLLICGIVSALYAAGMVVMGETLIEDVVKLMLVLIPTGIAVASDPRFGFLLVCAVSAGGFGLLFNSMDRARQQPR